MLFRSILLQITMSPKLNLKSNQRKLTCLCIMSLYSLCPYCRSFILSQLVKVFNTELLNTINLRLVPWGNAQVVNLTRPSLARFHLHFISYLYSFEFFSLLFNNCSCNTSDHPVGSFFVLICLVLKPFILKLRLLL